MKEILEIAPHLADKKYELKENMELAVRNFIHGEHYGKQQCEIRQSAFLKMVASTSPHDSGNGLYTNVDRKCCEVIGLFHGQICNEEQAMKLFDNKHSPLVKDASKLYTITYPNTRVYLNPKEKSASINDCRVAYDRRPRDEDFHRLNIVWVEIKYRGLIYVCETVTRDIGAGTELLTFYGEQYDPNKYVDLEKKRNDMISKAEKLKDRKIQSEEELVEALRRNLLQPPGIPRRKRRKRGAKKKVSKPQRRVRKEEARKQPYHEDVACVEIKEKKKKKAEVVIKKTKKKKVTELDVGRSSETAKAHRG
eukprot:TRINITY_DN1326_c0_g1_i1.p1 TRINITY_DN1326_c0_g1~~TRINITY_DN1326_c0_g1_i1.p1  ORF type:complete len:308 (+),score=68.05 TRINITY_DN1326_c0_g1_i1:385-1308(+)